MFKDIYPQPHTGGKLRAKDKKDWMGVKGDESRLVRCRFCGFIADTDRDLRLKDGSAAGRGKSLGSQKSNTYTLKGKSITDYYYEVTQVSGCPFCSSYLY